MRFYLSLASAILLLQPLTAAASPLTPEEALSRLSSSEFKKISASKPSFDVTPLSVVRMTNGNPGAYFMTGADNSLLLVGADTRTAPLLAYIPDARSIDSESMPPQLTWWLESYMKELSSLDGSDETDPGDTEDFAFKELYATIDASRTPVNPLLTTTWNQDYPYNSLCPNSSAGHAVTGCVATAMAQVMAYYQWPKKGRGYAEYNAGSFDYENVSFSWDEMRDYYSADDDESTFAERIAVAELMYACGVGVKMIYTPQISGAYSMRIADAMRDYFRYASTTCYKVRDVYSRLEWEDMLYRELEAGRPVLYGGRGELGGHSFVCDGYLSEGLFHFNWGWGGNYDGYFRISALNPMDVGIGGGSGQFNTDQDAIMGIYPDYEDEGGTEPSPLFSTGGFTQGSNYYNRGRKFDLQFTIDRGAIINPSAKSYSGTLGAMLFDGRNAPQWIPGSEAEFDPIDDEGQMDLKTRYSGSIIYDGLPQGEYRVYPATCREGEAPEIIRVCDATSQYVLMTVKEDGKASLRQDFSGVIPDITVTNISAPEKVITRNEMSCGITFVSGMTGYKGSLYLTATPEEGGAESIIGFLEVDQPEAHILISSIPIMAALEPGNHRLRVRDDMWRSLGPEPVFDLQYVGIESVSGEAGNVNGEDKARFYTIDGQLISDPAGQSKPIIRVSSNGAEKLLLK